MAASVWGPILAAQSIKRWLFQPATFWWAGARCSSRVECRPRVWARGWQAMRSPFLNSSTVLAVRRAPNHTFKPQLSNTSYTGIQYTPVDSSATTSTPQANIQSAIAF